MKTNTQKRRNAAKVSHFTKINQYRMQSQWKDESIFSCHIRSFMREEKREAGRKPKSIFCSYNDQNR